jgi:integrase
LSRTTSHQFLRRILRRSKSPSDDTMTKTAAQMFDEEEILAMISACGSSMERVMIATLYEGALRIKELGTLTWERVSFNEQNVVINVNVKANKPRRIPLFIAIIAITSLIGYFGIIKKK